MQVFDTDDNLIKEGMMLTGRSVKRIVLEPGDNTEGTLISLKERLFPRMLPAEEAEQPTDRRLKLLRLTPQGLVMMFQSSPEEHFRVIDNALPPDARFVRFYLPDYAPGRINDTAAVNDFGRDCLLVIHSASFEEVPINEIPPEMPPIMLQRLEAVKTD